MVDNGDLNKNEGVNGAANAEAASVAAGAASTEAAGVIGAMSATHEVGNETVGCAGFTSIMIIGVGLIGGSIAAAIKELDLGASAPVVYGVDIEQAALAGAKTRGFIDETLLLDGALTAGPVVDVVDEVHATDPTVTTVSTADATAKKSVAGKKPSADPSTQDIDGLLGSGKVDLVVLATPVSAAEYWFARIEASGYSGAITDVASTKGILTGLAERLLSAPGHYIPGHPMAGSEVNGIDGVRAGLFQNAHWILCPDERTDPDIFSKVHEFVTTLGARAISLAREEHDETIAVVSHVPHMVASALVQLAGAHAADTREIFRLAAGGFKDTTRIAAGSPELWCGIAMDNREALARGLDEIKQIITDIEGALAISDARTLLRLLEEAAALRTSIPATWVPDSARLVEVRIPMANHAGVIAQVTGFAAKAACNIQSIDIDHINEATAILELILTDEGDKGGFMSMLIEGGFDVSIRPLGYGV